MAADGTLIGTHSLTWSSAESHFYAEYPWSIQVYPTVKAVICHLRAELARVMSQEAWQQQEVKINIFLLCCALSSSVDDYLQGESYDFSRVQMVVPFAGPALRACQKFLRTKRSIRNCKLRPISRWRQQWDDAVQGFIPLLVPSFHHSGDDLANACYQIETSLAILLPQDLLSRRIKIPAAMHSQDLSHFDVFRLAEKFVRTFPDRRQAILVLGLRTAGSYLAPLLHAYLSAENYQDLDLVTIHPKRGIAARENTKLELAARKRAFVLIIDEPVGTGSTISAAVNLLRGIGCQDERVAVLLPVHPTARNWKSGSGFVGLSRVHFFVLQPEEYYKHLTLEPETVTPRLQEYFYGRGYESLEVAETQTTDRLNAQLRSLSEEKSQNRLKRIYEVRLRRREGGTERRWVLAKSVGWGWFSYHAFLAAQRLAEFVPPLLGLREGILYSEWIMQDETCASVDRAQLVKTAAAYTAARVRELPLQEDPTAVLVKEKRHLGVEKLTDALCQLYGGKVASALKRSRMQYELTCQPPRHPTFIDGRMRPPEWVHHSAGIYKSDFEQHGLGKFEFSITDPAYDLADFILHFGLSQQEERALLRHYTELCDDCDVEQRLFVNKLLAGTCAMALAYANVTDPRLSVRSTEFSDQYQRARTFLVIQATRFCGLLSNPQPTRAWRAPIVVLDIDGVLDTQSFGFPSTTAAGIEAMFRLNAHGLSIALDSARSIEEVKEYCNAYGCVGGIAEYGAWAWDAVSGKEQVLVSPESLWQLEQVKHELQRIPGVFLNNAYRYSLRAFVYDGGRTMAVPEPVMRGLMANLHVDRLMLHQTYTDSAVVATETNKGKGLRALLALAGKSEAETVAVGDSAPDLPMFEVATRSFGPSNLSCRSQASLVGCRVMGGRYQRGLLRIVENLVHPDNGVCYHCRDWVRFQRRTPTFFEKLLCRADENPKKLLLRALLDPMALRAFAK